MIKCDCISHDEKIALKESVRSKIKELESKLFLVRIKERIEPIFKEKIERAGPLASELKVPQINREINILKDINLELESMKECEDDKN